MNILDEIIGYKKQVVAASKATNPVRQLERSIYFDTEVVSFKNHLKCQDKVGVVAEIKRASPSTGILNANIDIAKISKGYIKSGASALSVLTEDQFFKGNNDDLTTVRKINDCPILRKDFVIDEYQLIEAKSIGASCVLLIASCLTPTMCKQLAAFAKSLQLEVILEVHSVEEIMEYSNVYIDTIGVNNRDLTNFTTDIDHSKKLYEFLPKELVKMSESGIQTAQQIQELKEVGFDGFLIGGFFMQHESPENACKRLIEDYEKLKR